MRGYTPFLGQVRLLHPRLGQIPGGLTVDTYDQDGFPVLEARVRVEYQSGAVDEGAVGKNGKFSVPVGPEREGRARITVTPPSGYAVEQSQKTEELFRDALVEVPFRLNKTAETPANSAVRSAAVAPSEFPIVPVLGGLAAVGLLAYLISR